MNDRVKPEVMGKDDLITEFIERFERVSLANEWTDQIKTKVFPALLPINSKYEKVYKEMPAEDKNSFQKIKTKLLSIDKLSRSIDVQNLFNIRRNQNEPFNRLVGRIEKLIDRCYTSFAKKNKSILVIDFFLNALPTSLRLKIEAQIGDQLLTEVEKVVKLAEEAEKPITTNIREISKQRIDFRPCHHCKKTNHKSSDCNMIKKSATLKVQMNINQR